MCFDCQIQQMFRNNVSWENINILKQKKLQVFCPFVDLLKNLAIRSLFLFLIGWRD